LRRAVACNKLTIRNPEDDATTQILGVNYEQIRAAIAPLVPAGRAAQQPGAGNRQDLVARRRQRPSLEPAQLLVLPPRHRHLVAHTREPREDRAGQGNRILPHRAAFEGKRGRGVDRALPFRDRRAAGRNVLSRAMSPRRSPCCAKRPSASSICFCRRTWRKETCRYGGSTWSKRCSPGPGRRGSVVAALRGKARLSRRVNICLHFGTGLKYPLRDASSRLSL